jgi:GT2 family glycosyltransferase
MPTYNRLATLQRAVAALDPQTVDSSRFELVVVSDGSTDGTLEFLEQASPAFHLLIGRQENSGPAAARNHGVRLARGDLILFLDDDVVAAPDLIEQHLCARPESDDRIVVIGPMLTPPDHRPNPFIRWEQSMLYKQYDAMKRGDWAPTYRQFYTGNASVGRRFIMSLGGFDERFRRGEDVELAYRLHEEGARFVFNDSAVGHHYAERSFESWLRNAREYGRNDVVFDRERRQSGRLEQVRVEYAGRNPLVRGLTRACLGRKTLESSLRHAAKSIIYGADRLGLEAITQSALSGLYNTTYYYGMADELGGPEAFWDTIRGGRSD